MLNTRDRAAEMLFIWEGVSLPKRRTNRSWERERTWKASAAEGLSRPFSGCGSIRTSQGGLAVMLLPGGEGDNDF